MKPDWECEGVRLYCGDALEVLPELGSRIADAVITDPPYGVDLSYESHDDNRDEYLGLVPRWKSAIDSITDGPRLISCGIANIGVWEASHWVIAWLKPAAMGRCSIGFNNWEPVLCYGKPARCNTDAFTACITPDKSLAGHPCPKPLGWATEQIERYTTGTICDPFMGSGTTGVACVKLDRQFIGIEKEPKYFDIAVKRIEQAIRDKKSELPFMREPQPTQKAFI